MFWASPLTILSQQGKGMGQTSYLCGLLLCGIFATVSTVQAEAEVNCMLDLAFLIDTSNSLYAEYFKQKVFVIRLATKLNITKECRRVGVITFSESRLSRIAIKLNRYFNTKDFVIAVNQLPEQYGYFTRIDLALKLAKDTLFSEEGGARKESRKVILVLSDGKQNPTQYGNNTYDPVMIANELRKHDVELYALLVGQDTRKEAMKNITNNENHIFDFKTYDAILATDIAGQVFDKIFENKKKNKMLKIKPKSINPLLSTKPPNTVVKPFTSNFVEVTAGRTIDSQLNVDKLSPTKPFIKQVEESIKNQKVVDVGNRMTLPSPTPRAKLKPVLRGKKESGRKGGEKEEGVSEAVDQGNANEKSSTERNPTISKGNKKDTLTKLKITNSTKSDMIIKKPFPPDVLALIKNKEIVPGKNEKSSEPLNPQTKGLKALPDSKLKNKLIDSTLNPGRAELNKAGNGDLEKKRQGNTQRTKSASSKKEEDNVFLTAKEVLKEKDFIEREDSGSPVNVKSSRKETKASKDEKLTKDITTDTLKQTAKTVAQNRKIINQHSNMSKEVAHSKKVMNVKSILSSVKAKDQSTSENQPVGGNKKKQTSSKRNGENDKVITGSKNKRPQTAAVKKKYEKNQDQDAQGIESTKGKKSDTVKKSSQPKINKQDQQSKSYIKGAPESTIGTKAGTDTGSSSGNKKTLPLPDSYKKEKGMTAIKPGFDKRKGNNSLSVKRDTEKSSPTKNSGSTIISKHVILNEKQKNLEIKIVAAKKEVTKFVSNIEGTAKDSRVSNTLISSKSVEVGKSSLYDKVKSIKPESPLLMPGGKKRTVVSGTTTAASKHANRDGSTKKKEPNGDDRRSDTKQMGKKKQDNPLVVEKREKEIKTEDTAGMQVMKLLIGVKSSRSKDIKGVGKAGSSKEEKNKLTKESMTTMKRDSDKQKNAGTTDLHSIETLNKEKKEETKKMTEHGEKKTIDTKGKAEENKLGKETGEGRKVKEKREEEKSIETEKDMEEKEILHHKKKQRKEKERKTKKKTKQGKSQEQREKEIENKEKKEETVQKIGRDDKNGEKQKKVKEQEKLKGIKDDIKGEKEEEEKKEQTKVKKAKEDDKMGEKVKEGENKKRLERKKMVEGVKEGEKREKEKDTRRKAKEKEAKSDGMETKTTEGIIQPTQMSLIGPTKSNVTRDPSILTSSDKGYDFLVHGKTSTETFETTQNKTKKIFYAGKTSPATSLGQNIQGEAQNISKDGEDENRVGKVRSQLEQETPLENRSKAPGKMTNVKESKSCASCDCTKCCNKRGSSVPNVFINVLDNSYGYNYVVNGIPVAGGDTRTLALQQKSLGGLSFKEVGALVEGVVADPRSAAAIIDTFAAKASKRKRGDGKRNKRSKIKMDNMPWKTMDVYTSTYLRGSKNFIKALKALRLIRYVAEGRSREPLIIFAPTDSAYFEGLTSLYSMDLELMKDRLSYHITVSEGKGSSLFRSVDGKYVLRMYRDVSSQDSKTKLLVENALIVGGPIQAANGIIYLIDRILVPPSKTLAELVGEHPKLNTFNKMLQRSGLLEEMKNGDGPDLKEICVDRHFCFQAKAEMQKRLRQTVSERQFTIYAPTDEHMALVPKQTMSTVLASPKLLRFVVGSYITYGATFSCTVNERTRSFAPTMGMSNVLYVTSADKDGNLEYSDVFGKVSFRATVKDLRAKDGVLHLINGQESQMN